jgi:hypothetical protein
VTIENGTRLRALVDFETTALVHWQAPMTSGACCNVKRGTIFRVFSVAALGMGVFSATLEDRKIEAGFAGKKNYASSGYGGLSFVFDVAELGRHLEPV